MLARLRNVLVASAVLFAAFAVVVPTASAQAAAGDTTLEIKITPFDTPIKPLSGLGAGKVSIIYCYVAAGFGLVGTPVQLKVAEAPAWATVTISPSTVIIPVSTGAPGGGQICAPAKEANVVVSTTADAPAFTPTNIRITGAALANGDLKPSNSEDASPVQADYFSIIDAVAGSTIQLATPQSQVAYPITITNFGNAQTKVFFDVTEKPDGWQVVAPIPTNLEAKQAGGKNTAQTVNLMIQTPFRNGYLNEVGAVTMKVTSAYALNNQLKGDQTQVSTLTTTRGFYVPGFEPILLLAGLGAVALVVGRRR